MDTWRRYKLGQARFITWLQQTAVKVAPKPPDEPQGVHGSRKLESTFSKEKRKETPTQDTIGGLALKDIERSAKIVVDNANPGEVPVKVIKTLRKVITLRKKSAEFWHNTALECKDKDMTESNTRHAHMIAVLERIMAMLEDICSKATPTSQKPEQQGIQLSNMFENLYVSDHEAMNSDDDDVDIQPQKKPTKRVKSRNSQRGKAKRDGKKYLQGGSTKREPENESSWADNSGYTDETLDKEAARADDDPQDIYLIIYCLFEGFNSIKNYIVERYCDYFYKDHAAPLDFLAVLTNLAFELFHQLEEGYKSLIPDSSPEGEISLRLAAEYEELGEQKQYGTTNPQERFKLQKAVMANLFEDMTVIKRLKETRTEDVVLPSEPEIWRDLGEPDEVEKVQPFHLVKSEPVWAGLLEFHARLVLFQIGDVFTRSSAVIGAAGYIYSAARVHNPGSVPKWQMMEKWTDTAYSSASIFKKGTSLASPVAILRHCPKGLANMLNPKDPNPRMLYAVALFGRYVSCCRLEHHFMEYMSEIAQWRSALTAPEMNASEKACKDIPVTNNNTTDSFTTEKGGGQKLKNANPLGLLELLDEILSNEINDILAVDHFDLFDQSIRLLESVHASSEGLGLQKRLGWPRDQSGILPKLPELLLHRCDAGNADEILDAMARAVGGCTEEFQKQPNSSFEEDEENDEDNDPGVKYDKYVDTSSSRLRGKWAMGWKQSK
ncbi:hypothetical protein B0T17DRAFT_508020 [Bombardia bombarda]|uniref:DUF6604 domain-containing protein n=1 Tax=Bombardia bombarda TaxID=252184 RepID=A0AA40C510_9PEZI|nr:hypothetical protein B0T17DRAFT_508020 [Bombardia bombarda]